MKALVGAALTLAFLTPAWSGEFYIVRDVKTGKCSIVDRRPTSSEVVIAGDGKAFISFEEGTIAIQTLRICNNG